MDTSSTTFLMRSDGKLAAMRLSSLMSRPLAIVVAQLQPGMIVPVAQPGLPMCHKLWPCSPRKAHIELSSEAEESRLRFPLLVGSC
eukprot:8686920-Heterocapsa_arctica.AAC.1